MNPQLIGIAEVPGAVRDELVKETLPCGDGYAHRFFDADGRLLRQDYHVVVTGFEVSAGGGEL